MPVPLYIHIAQTFVLYLQQKACVPSKKWKLRSKQMVSSLFAYYLENLKSWMCSVSLIGVIWPKCQPGRNTDGSFLDLAKGILHCLSEFGRVVKPATPSAQVTTGRSWFCISTPVRCCAPNNSKWLHPYYYCEIFLRNIRRIGYALVWRQGSATVRFIYGNRYFRNGAGSIWEHNTTLS